MKLKPKQSVFGILRISLGWIFLWPFLDKLFGLGFATEKANAWITGGSPTSGYLSFATQGPFSEIFQTLSGQLWVDWLFMIGLLLIGLALILGIGVRIAAYSGTLMLFMMWLAVLPPEHNPFMDDHLIYGIALIALSLIDSGSWLGCGKWWSKQKIVKTYPILK